MKKGLLLVAIGLGLLTASCTKKTDNYYANPTPAFVISGIQDLKIQAGAIPMAALNLTVQYMDSTQGRVTLAISGLPAGITMDTSATLSGIPTFYTTLTFLDTSSTPAAPGTYPITLTAYSSTSAQKTFSFNITVLPAVSYTTNIVGKYTNCTTSCNNGTYTDSIYADANVANKIYFHNFMNTGQTVYATVSLYNAQYQDYTIFVPQQTVNGYTFANTTGDYSNSQLIMYSVQYTYNGISSNCTLTMMR